MCDQCGQSFHNTSNLARHKAKKHADGGSKSLVVLKKIEAAPVSMNFLTYEIKLAVYILVLVTSTA